MTWNIDTILKEIKFLERYMTSLKGEELVYKFFRLTELINFYDAMKYLGKDSRTSVTKTQMSHIKDYEYNLGGITALEYFKNQEFYQKESLVIYRQIKDTSLTQIRLQELKEIECLNLVMEFLNSFDKNLTIYFKDMINRNKINIGKMRINTSYCGLTTLYSKDPYVMCNEKNMTIYTSFILVHEFGHALIRFMTKNHSYKDLLTIPNSLYEEVVPMFLENIFLNYLIDNNLFKKESIYLKKDEFNELKEVSKVLNLITNIPNIRYNHSFDIEISANKLKEIIQNSKISYEEYSLKYLQNLNIKETLKYFYGYLLGLEFANEYKSNPKTKEDIYDFITNMALIDSEKVNKVIENSKVLKREFKK